MGGRPGVMWTRYDSSERSRVLRVSLADQSDEVLARALEELVVLSSEIHALASRSDQWGDHEWSAEIGMGLDRIKREVVAIGRADLRASFIRFGAHAPDGTVLNETSLFSLIARRPELLPRVDQLLRNLALGAERTSRYSHFLWADEMVPAGTRAAAACALETTAALPMLADFISRCDLDHASVFDRLCHVVLRKHGWCDEAWELVAQRCTRASSDESFLSTLHLAMTDETLDARSYLLHGERLDAFLAKVQGLNEGRRRNLSEQIRNALYLNDDSGWSSHRTRTLGMIERFPGKTSIEHELRPGLDWDPDHDTWTAAVHDRS